MSSGSGRPIRLVYCDEKGKYHVDPEAVALLQLVKQPVGVVSVCGPACEGKSFLLNQLLGRSNGFQVGSTHRPCTEGLWLWSTPIQTTAPDGTQYSILLIDSAGIEDTKITHIAVLLSSMIIYNQMCGLSETSLHKISLLSEITKRVRASGSSACELGQLSPIFVCVLRDFYLNLREDNGKITPRDYLESEIRESKRDIFPDRECFTLVRPLCDESDLQRLDQISPDKLRPEFRSGLDSLTKFVFERTRPKQMGSNLMTGPILAYITQSIRDALNVGDMPTITSLWKIAEELAYSDNLFLGLHHWVEDEDIFDEVGVDEGYGFSRNPTQLHTKRPTHLIFSEGSRFIEFVVESVVDEQTEAQVDLQQVAVEEVGQEEEAAGEVDGPVGLQHVALEEVFVEIEGPVGAEGADFADPEVGPRQCAATENAGVKSDCYAPQSPEKEDLVSWLSGMSGVPDVGTSS